LEKREMEFRIRMLAKGIHVMHGGGCLTTAHSDEDIGKIVKAARSVAREMVSSVRSSEFGVQGLERSLQTLGLKFYN
jgi:hypothetical protein